MFNKYLCIFSYHAVGVHLRPYQASFNLNTLSSHPFKTIKLRHINDPVHVTMQESSLNVELIYFPSTLASNNAPDSSYTRCGGKGLIKINTFSLTIGSRHSHNFSLELVHPLRTMGFLAIRQIGPISRIILIVHCTHPFFILLYCLEKLWSSLHVRA